MHRPLLDHLKVLAFVLLCSVGSISAAWNVRNAGNALSQVDAFSESNAIREVRNFLDTGIAANDGLGNVLRPGLYSEEGFEGHPETRAHSLTPSGVYTHYPPGPEYILYVAMRLLGTHPIARLRIVPLMITWLAAVFFGLSLRHRFGMPCAAFVMLACAVLPVFSDADAYLHYDGYALALLLVEIGLCLGRSTQVLPFAVLGFGQGWLSFDYFFLVALVPGALELALPRLDADHTARKHLALWRCTAAAAGFVFAHLLHFTEVCAYFGSFQAAFRDLRGAAAYRTGEIGPLLRIVLTCHVLMHYFSGVNSIGILLGQPAVRRLEPQQAFRFGGLALGTWLLLLTLWFLLVRLIRQRRAQTSAAALQIDDDWLVVTLCGIIPCSLWFVAMPEHAFIHEHFLYRHLFFCFFLNVLFVALALERALRSVDVHGLAVLRDLDVSLFARIRKNLRGTSQQRRLHH